MNKFELFRGDLFIGVVTLSPLECDFPWSVGYLEPSDEYKEVSHLFMEEAKAARAVIESGSEEAIHAANEALMKVLQPGIRMKNPLDDEYMDIIGISIEGNRVSWR